MKRNEYFCNIIMKTHFDRFLKQWSKSAIAIFAAILLTSCASQGEWYQASGATWGTSFHIRYHAGRALDDTIVATMGMIDDLFSFRNPESEISRINNAPDPVVPSAEFTRLLEVSRRISAMSGGAFDPTVGPLVDIWGFGKGKVNRDSEGRLEAPEQAVIDSLLNIVGISECSIDSRGRLIKKSPATRFDFSAIAKGYGVDCVALALERNGAEDYMVEIGGEVRVRGLNPEGEEWTISVDSPEAGNDIVPGSLSATRIQLKQGAIATSSNSRNRQRLSDGKIAGHTISPATGRPASTDMLSATIVANDCMTADALATACMVLPSADAMRMVEEEKIAAFFVIITESDTKIWKSSEWEKMFNKV